MEFNGQSITASLTNDIMLSGYLKTDCSDPSPWNEEGLPSPLLSCLLLLCLPLLSFLPPYPLTPLVPSHHLHHLPSLSIFIPSLPFCPLLPSLLASFVSYSFILFPTKNKSPPPILRTWDPYMKKLRNKKK